MKHLLTSLVALALVVPAVSQAQGVSLKFKPIKGDKSVYDLSFDIEGLGQSLVYKAKVENEVVEVKEDGTYVVASNQGDAVVVSEGVEQATSAPTTTSVSTFSALGRTLKIAGDEATPESFRVANLTSFVAQEAPIEIGQSWTVDIEADAEAGTVSVKHVYKFLRKETTDGKEIAVVEFSSEEISGSNPCSAKGTLTIEIATGRQLTYSAQVKDLPVGPQFVSGKLEVKIRTGGAS